jgi:hypothetical protein
LKLLAFFNVYYGKTGLDNQAHTTSPPASSALVCSAISVHRNRLTSVTIAKRHEAG